MTFNVIFIIWCDFGVVFLNFCHAFIIDFVVFSDFATTCERFFRVICLFRLKGQLYLALIVLLGQF